MSLKVRIALIVVVMAVVIGVSYWYMQVTTGKQEQVVEKKWRLRDNLMGVSFCDDDNGWAVGQYGTILHTTDRGKAWEYQKSGTNINLVGVFAVNPETAWAVGYAGTAVHTSDGGKTWNAVKTWTKYLYNGVHFVSPEEGWIVGEFEVILHTLDGGKTWKKAHGGEPEPIDFDALAKGEIVDADYGMEEEVYTLNSVYFLNKDLGWAAGEYGTIIHTSDGGATWEKQKPGTDHSLMDIEFVTPEFGLAVGLDSTILKTKDGGTTWMKEKPTVKTHYYGVTFRRYGPDVVRHDAFAVGQGVIAYYSYLKKEYLQNWMPAAEMKYDITYNWMYDVAFNARTGEEGIAVGEHGIVLRTPSGGHEWVLIDYPEKSLDYVMNP